MSNLAIRVENLSKQYRIGAPQPRYKTIRESLMNGLTVPVRRLRSTFQPSNLQPANDNYVWALKDVSFNVKQGEVVGIIGRNGAGKSTLLKILSRITEPTEGRAEVYGRVGSLLEVGTGFHPELTGRENIYLNGAILGMKKAEIERKFDEIVAFAEVEKFIDTPIKHYSSGMYVRLAFAVAAHLEPEILLVDEVLSVGDAAFQKKCLGKMGEVAKRGRTVLFVSHNMTAILNLCSEAFLISYGALLTKGPTHATVLHYLQTVQSATSEDLAPHRERRGHGRVRFSRILILDTNGRTINHAMSGQSVRIVLEYRSQLEDTLPNCRVSIAVEDLFGQPLFVCSTEMARDQPTSLSPNGTVHCVIPRLPLSQGRYYLTLFLEVNHEIEDWLQSAASLNVVDGDFFESGRQYPEGWQGKGVLVPHEWVVTSKCTLA
jgi:lipopolysaccharide transport system ATP-binding protein